MVQADRYNTWALTAIVFCGLFYFCFFYFEAVSESKLKAT
jgi:hypothetical protein